MRCNKVKVFPVGTCGMAERFHVARQPDPVSDLVARLKNASEGSSCLDQKPKSTWKAVLGWAVGIGFALLAAFAAIGVDPSMIRHPGADPGLS
jgi:hypothetical protein